MSNPVSEMLFDSMEKIREMVDANTVVGNPITTPQGVTLIPISKISCAYAGGGTEFNGKFVEQDLPFGGGSGCSLKVTPVAFMVVKEDSVRMMPVTEAPASPVDRLVETLPELVEMISGLIKKQKADNAELIVEK